MSPPVTHEEIGIVLALAAGGSALSIGLLTLASGFGDITPSQRTGDIGCGFWLTVIGLVILVGVGLLWLIGAI